VVNQIEAMKQALEALESIRPQNMTPLIHPAKTTLRTAIEEAETAQGQEPLGYIASMAANDLRASIYRDVTVYGEDLEETVAIYTTPPAARPAEWKELTDEEILSVVYDTKVARAIEAKLREKNTGETR
jgi:hypothetical protein